MGPRFLPLPPGGRLAAGKEEEGPRAGPPSGVTPGPLGGAGTDLFPTAEGFPGPARPGLVPESPLGAVGVPDLGVGLVPHPRRKGGQRCPGAAQRALPGHLSLRAPAHFILPGVGRARAGAGRHPFCARFSSGRVLSVPPVVSSCPNTS